MTNHKPYLGSVSKPLTRLFVLMVKQPSRWFTVAELMTEGATSSATVYRRCGGLVAARVMLRRRQNDQAEFKLHPRWDDRELGQRLLGRIEGSPGASSNPSGSVG